MSSELRDLTALEVAEIIDSIDAALGISQLLIAPDGGGDGDATTTYNRARARGLNEARHIVLSVCQYPDGAPE